MTNQEINKRIAELLGYTVRYKYVSGEVRTNCRPPKFLNYCNNWNQLMPLVIQHNISHYRPKEIDSDIWIASKYNAIKQEIIEAFYFSPQMALCMCLIKVLEAEMEGKET